MFTSTTRELLMGYPTDGQTYNLVKQLEKNIDMIDDELISIKSMLVNQTIQLIEIRDAFQSLINNKSIAAKARKDNT
jgi:hypothetical protein